MAKKILRALGYAFTSILFIMGALIFVYPLLNSYLINQNAETALEDFHNWQDTISEQSVGGPNSDTADRIHHFDKLYEDMQTYNENLVQNGQSGLKDAWSYEQSAFDLSMYGIHGGVVAEMRIPKMDVDLPVYLGATWNNMSKGAAQLGQTSMPIGGNNTNCAIAGHRGSSGGEFFLNIENLELGDVVYLDNLWETLSYCVYQIEIIDPEDVDKILIQRDKDLLTLITCHPYPYDTRRYLVYCERIPNDLLEQKASSDRTHLESTVKRSGNSQAFMTFEKILYYVIPVILIILVVCLFGKNPRKGRSSR